MTAWRAGVAEVAALARAAEALGRRARARNPRARGDTRALRRRALPDLWLFTDPERTPDPVALARRLPRGAGIVLRTFGRHEVEALAPALADLARRRGLVLLVGADAALAARIAADGVHLPERRVADAALLRARRPGWIVTAAVHDGRALARAARAGADAAFLSPAFASASASAGAPLGPVRFATLARRARLPVYALGGMDAATARRLIGAGAAGVAAVDAFRT